MKLISFGRYVFDRIYQSGIWIPVTFITLLFAVGLALTEEESLPPQKTFTEADVQRLAGLEMSNRLAAVELEREFEAEGLKRPDSQRVWSQMIIGRASEIREREYHFAKRMLEVGLYD